MTAHTLEPLTSIASDTNYRNAQLILGKNPELRFSNPSLEDIKIIAKKAVTELVTDPDFCENKAHASRLALKWLFENLYQNNIPLEERQFYNLCEDCIIDDDEEPTEKEMFWYQKK